MKLLLTLFGFALAFFFTGINGSAAIQSKAIDSCSPLVELKTNNSSAKKIVEVAINNLAKNYIQNPYNAKLFFRFTGINKADSIFYQSESILDYYDSKGYQKRQWRNAASSRFANIKEGRIIVGTQENEKGFSELDKIFVFWAHEPIVTNDKPISLSSIDAYEFKLIGEKEFMGETVYEVTFECNKLKAKYTGLPSLKSFSGKLFINKKDYAILKYEHNFEMDYEFKNKRTKQAWGGSERRIIKSSKIEVFQNGESGYYLDYAKVNSRNEIQFIKKDGEKEIKVNKLIEEYQFYDVDTKNVKPLTKNLLKLNHTVNYNPTFWENFKPVMK